MSYLPHLAIPFQIGPDGTALIVQQDTIDDVAQCVEVLVATTTGSRIPVPGYGTIDQTFSQQPSPGPVLAAINTWEPRAAATITIGNSGMRDVSLNITVALSTNGG